MIRAATMASFVLGGRATGMSLTPGPPWVAAVALLLAVSGDLAYDVGFQFSAVATAGVLLGARLWSDRMPRLVWALLAATVSAQVAVAPIRPSPLRFGAAAGSGGQPGRGAPGHGGDGGCRGGGHDRLGIGAASGRMGGGSRAPCCEVRRRVAPTRGSCCDRLGIVGSGYLAGQSPVGDAGCRRRGCRGSVMPSGPPSVPTVDLLGRRSGRWRVIA